jgi:hypothetical protein
MQLTKATKIITSQAPLVLVIEDSACGAAKLTGMIL